MTKILDTVLLLALPASGKSEVRTFLARLDPATCADEYHLGPTVQLDDFPYVHLMRRIDDTLAAMGERTVYFQAADKPFRDGRDWGTLIELLNEDHEFVAGRAERAPVSSAAAWLTDRLERARARVGAPPALAGLDATKRARVHDAIERESRALHDEQAAARPQTLSGKTLVIEFARGGPHGATPPLPAPLGYAYSLARLSPALLERAAILYVWVTPEESRRKNQARANPDDPGSILHHGVPIDVMLGDYGCDDMAHLIETSDRPDTVRVEAHGRVYHLPVARFDNRVDKTTFVRCDPASWKPEDARALGGALGEALGRLARAR